MKKVGIICLGNPLRRDDGIGLVLLDRLIEKSSQFPEEFEFIDGGTGGMGLLHIFSRFDIVVLIDAVNLNCKPGKSKFFKLSDILTKKEKNTNFTHVPDFLNVLELAKSLGELPEMVFIFGIQPNDTSYGCDLTIELSKKTDMIFKELLNKLKSITNTIGNE